jgi:hypothetical protein
MCEGASVSLHVRCGGCTKLYQRSVTLPAGSAAPSDGDELMEFPEIRGLRFSCPRCEAPYAEIVAFRILEKKEAA